MMSWITFWIPLDSGDRISFSTTLLLSVIATIFITADKRPATCSDMWLDQFQSAAFLFTMLPIVETVLLVRLSSLDEEARRLERAKKFQKMRRQTQHDEH